MAFLTVAIVLVAGAFRADLERLDRLNQVLQKTPPQDRKQVAALLENHDVDRAILFVHWLIPQALDYSPYEKARRRQSTGWLEGDAVEQFSKHFWQDKTRPAIEPGNEIKWHPISVEAGLPVNGDVLVTVKGMLLSPEHERCMNVTFDCLVVQGPYGLRITQLWVDQDPTGELITKFLNQ